MSRLFELLNECARCRRRSFGCVRLYTLNDDRWLKFCTTRCKDQYLDEHPSDLGDADPRVLGR